MANNKSALKRERQNIKRHARNRSLRSRMRTAIKSLREAVEAGDADTAKSLLSKTESIVNATAQKGAIHRNAAARTTSRLTTAVNGLQG